MKQKRYTIQIAATKDNCMMFHRKDFQSKLVYAKPVEHQTKILEQLHRKPT